MWLLTALAVIDRYNRLPPHDLTNLSECGDWTLRGSAVSMKSFIRLTSAVSGDFGAVCNRIPTTFRDWMFELEISARGKDKGGRGFFWYFTDEACAEISLRYNGLAMWVNTSTNNSQGYSPLYLVGNNGSLADLEAATPVGEIQLRNMKRPIRIQVRRTGDHVKITSDTRLIHDTYITGLPDYGFFSVSAATEISSDTNDLHGIRVLPLATESRKVNTEEYDRRIRKELEGYQQGRSEPKKIRRMVMRTIQKYGNQSKSKKDVLDAKNIDLRDAFKMIIEAKYRGESFTNVILLNNFINNYVEKTVKKAVSKITLATEEYSSIQESINLLWADFRSSLMEMRMSTRMTMQAIEKEVVAMAKDLKLHDVKASDAMLSADNARAQTGESFTATGLYFVMILELVAYVIFFLYKRQKTAGFKKLD